MGRERMNGSAGDSGSGGGGRGRRGRYVVGITGASGALYAQRTVRVLLGLGHEVHLVVTSYGKRLLRDELGAAVLGSEGGLDLRVFAGLGSGEEPRERGLFVHPSKDVGASLGSGSFRHDGMIVIPCSSNTLGQVASGAGDQLLTRAAAVCLKERFPLVLVHREAPLNRVDLRNMLELHDAGACIMPANPGFYLGPGSVMDLVDFVVARSLDQLGVEHEVSSRWSQELADRSTH